MCEEEIKCILTLNAGFGVSKQLAQSVCSKHVGRAVNVIIVSFWISCPLKFTR